MKSRKQTAATAKVAAAGPVPIKPALKLEETIAQRREEYLDRVKKFVSGEYREWMEQDRVRVGILLEVMEKHSGSTSPAEQFIESILSSYLVNGTLTPESIMSDFDDFKENLDDMARWTRRFIRQYPNLAN